MDDEERKAYYRERYHRTRREAVESLGGQCIDCGATDDLEFDHADRATKKFEMSLLMSGQRRELLLAELAKCVLRCSPCHAKKSTASGDNHAVEHGGGVSGKKNCKCDLCHARKAEYMREWKRQHRSHGGDS